MSGFVKFLRAVATPPYNPCFLPVGLVRHLFGLYSVIRYEK